MNCANRPKLGFLGTGPTGLHRLEAIRASDAAEIAAVCAPTQSLNAETARVAPEASIMTDYEKMLDADLDGIMIATPTAFRARHAIRALQKGKSVFCLEPLGGRADEVRAVINAARASNRLLRVDHSLRRTQAMQSIRQTLVKKVIGQIYGVELVFHNAFGPNEAWLQDPTLSAGGCVMDQGVRLLDLALWALGFPALEKASSTLWSKGHPIHRSDHQIEDHAIATIHLENGATLRLACSWNLPTEQDSVIETTFFGEDGALTFKNVNGSFHEFTATLMRGPSQKLLFAPPDFWAGRAAVAWADLLSRGGNFDHEEAAGLERVAEVVDSIYSRV